MARSSWKFNYIINSSYKNIFLSKFKQLKKVNKIFSRSSSVLKHFLKKNVYIYKGNMFVKILFNRYCVGYKIGEFSVTRKPFSFPLKKSKR